MKISENISRLKPSGTLAMNNKVLEMKHRGIDIINLSAGQPDFSTPDNVKRAGILAIENNRTYYTSSTGIPELKKAISNKLKRENNLDYSHNQIIVSCGAKQALYNACFSLLNKGDEVMIISPYWCTYYAIIQLTGAIPIILNTKIENDLKVQIDELKKNCSRKTKALIFNNPNNPSGTFYEKNEISAIAQFCIENDIAIISDEIYEKLVYDNKQFVSFASLNKDIYEKTITVNGVSKSYAMTGWRIGYAAGPEHIIESMGRLQGHCTSNPASISQYASIEALDNADDSIKIMLKEFERRRDFVYNKLSKMEGIKVFKPEGAFYIFPQISNFYGRSYKGNIINDSNEFCTSLLTEARLALVPGFDFSNDNHVRISFANSMEKLVQAMERLGNFLNHLK